MHSLVMTPFSRDLIKLKVYQLRYLQCLASVQHLYSAWFLDGNNVVMFYTRMIKN